MRYDFQRMFNVSFRSVKNLHSLLVYRTSMALLGRCLFWAAVCGALVGFVLGGSAAGGVAPVADSSAAVGSPPQPVGTSSSSTSSVVGSPSVLPVDGTSSDVSTTSCTTPSLAATCAVWVSTSTTTTSSSSSSLPEWTDDPFPEPQPEAVAAAWNTVGGGNSNTGGWQDWPRDSGWTPTSSSASWHGGWESGGWRDMNPGSSSGSSHWDGAWRGASWSSPSWHNERDGWHDAWHSGWNNPNDNRGWQDWSDRHWAQPPARGAPAHGRDDAWGRPAADVRARAPRGQGRAPEMPRPAADDRAHGREGDWSRPAAAVRAYGPPGRAGHAPAAGSSSSSAAGAPTRPMGGTSHSAPSGFWKHGTWQARERTSSEERLQRGGQGPIRQGRRNQRARAWEDGSFRAAVFRHGVDRSSPEAAEARRKLALLLGVPNQGGPAWGPQPWAAWESWTSGPPMWSAQQWANWEQWTSNPAMVVDWSGSGVPPIWHVRFEDDDDDGSFVQLDVCPSGGCSVDELDLMQLTGAEEELLAEIHLPDNLRRDLREMLYTLQRHSDEDLGPEFRWGLQEWLQAWSDGCRRTEQIVNCLRRRVDSSGVVPYWPVVRGPRHAAHRVRSLSWNRQWTRVVCGIVEAMVDLLMVQHINLVPTDPEVAPTRPVTTPSRSRSRDGGDDATGAASSSSSTGRFRVRRVRRRVGTADVPGVSSAASADSAASSSLPVTGEAPGAAVDAVPVPAGSSTPLVAPDTLVDAGVEPTVTEDVALVQRLQPSEAQELARLGFRRECISAIGLFLGNLASIVEGVQPAGDLPAGDVQWCLRVVDTAIQNVMEAQDYVSTLLGRRITGGDCVLPDGAARGPGCQLSHTMVVSMARAVLDGLHERVANAWLDPEGLPPELRRDPALFVDDFGELGGYGDGDDGDATADEARVETVENVDVPALSSTDVPATASSMGVARRRSLAIVHHGVAATSSQPASVSPTGVPSANAGRVPADGHSGAGRDRSRSPRGESEEDVSNLMQRLDQAEGELLRETGMSRSGLLQLQDFLGHVHGEDVDSEWMVLLMQSVFEAQMLLLRRLCEVLRVRAGGERALPPEPGRLAAVQGCRDVLRTVQDELGEICLGVLRDAQMDPYCLPLRLHGRVPPCGPRWGEPPSGSGSVPPSSASLRALRRDRSRSPRREQPDGCVGAGAEDGP